MRPACRKDLGDTAPKRGGGHVCHVGADATGCPQQRAQQLRNPGDGQTHLVGKRKPRFMYKLRETHSWGFGAYLGESFSSKVA